MKQILITDTRLLGADSGFTTTLFRALHCKDSLLTLSTSAAPSFLNAGLLRVIISRLRDTTLLPEDAEPDITVYITLFAKLIIVGPLVKRGQAGCTYCLRTRIPNAIGAKWPLHPVEPHLSPAHITIIARLIYSLISEQLSHSPTKRLYLLHEDTLSVTSEGFAPSSLCPKCSKMNWLPFESLVDELSKESSPTRRYPVSVVGSAVKSTYGGARFGICRNIRRDLQTPVPMVIANVVVPNRSTEPVIGRSNSFVISECIAAVEGLERYCGLVKDPPHLVVGTFNDFQSVAINPRLLGLHAEDAYSSPSFRLSRFREDLAIEWAWGYYADNAQAVLVPACAAFYGYQSDKYPRFIYETSNGCAVGSSVAESILHGILELVERDSFLSTWYGERCHSRIAIDSLCDKYVSELNTRIELMCSCQVELYNNTSDHGIPSVFAHVILSGENRPRQICAGGAGVSLTAAVQSALIELAGIIPRVSAVYPDRRREALLMLEDSGKVLSMEDHALLNALPEAQCRFEFLHGNLEQAVSSSSVEARLKSCANPRETLSQLLAGLSGVGYRAIVVDQTRSELRHVGLHCVKVIVAGLLPMTFGHLNRRVEFPGRKHSEFTKHELPHPFP